MQRDEEKEETAKAFQAAFNLPGQPDENLVKPRTTSQSRFYLMAIERIIPRPTED